MVYEVDFEGNVVHVRDLGKPEGIKLKAPAPEITIEDTESSNEGWNSNVDTKLAELLPGDVCTRLKALYEEGPEPPVDPTGDGGLEAEAKNEEKAGDVPALAPEASQIDREGGRGRGRNRGRGRGRGQGGRGGSRREDTRRVLTDVGVLYFVYGHRYLT